MAGLLMIVFIFTKKNKALLNKRKDTHLEGKVNFGLIFFLCYRIFYGVSNLFYFSRWDQK